jgi:N-acetylglutamate synthase-like GNAT family acetyltransferase
MRVEQAGVGDILPFRLAQLRPAGHPPEPPKPGDLHPLAAHFVARDDRGDIVACASVHPDPSGASGAWQLRAVATRADARGAGHGRAVVEACLAHARGHDARRVWCNGRVGARGFYERLGFRVTSDVFELRVSGPHHLMEIAL